MTDHVINNMPTQFTNKIIFTLLWLSIVVNFTNSCSSFNSWKSNEKKRANTNNNKIALTTPVSIENLTCSEALNRDYCQNGGRCVMRLEPECICAEGWSGKRCMQKEPDEKYDVKVNRTSETISSTLKPNQPSDRPEFHSNLTSIHTKKCDAPYDELFCLNKGRCYQLLLGEYWCQCEHPYIGRRCEEKALEGSYNTRKIRDLSSSKIALTTLQNIFRN